MDLDEFLIRHDGVISRQQALGLGMSSAAISRRVDSGRWRGVTRGVYLAAGHPRSARAQARLAVAAVGPTAVLGGAAAAWWLGFVADEPHRQVVFTSAVGDHRRRTSTSLVRHRRLCAEDVSIHRHLRVTSPALTALDAAEEIGLKALDAVLLRRFTTVDGLLRAHARYPTVRDKSDRG
ncbi:type IV toxin-antitoxin system AbiEi family antitoxin domain-containing protein [Gordonia crocea]|nr:type IV toxin-antitoxin system AbiEi family antitoxin domain-containing protein [Gordonia crocea]